jgi:diacylglycerol kinase family enzyme
MYFYIVDPSKMPQKEFERVQHVLYSSLSDYRISGEVVRVTGVRTIQQLVETAFSHEAKTIVAVGSDQTLHEIINAIGRREMTIGFIPLVNSELANIFGIKDLEQAVKIIAFRRIETLDLCSVNNNYFLSKLTFGAIDKNLGLPNLDKTFEIKIKVDSQYLATQEIAAGAVVNTSDSEADTAITHPNDGSLDILLLPQLTRWQTIRYRKEIFSGNFESIPQASVIHGKKIQILSPEGMALKIGDWLVAKTPAQIEVVPAALKIIVGRERKF